MTGVDPKAPLASASSATLGGLPFAGNSAPGLVLPFHLRRLRAQRSHLLLTTVSSSIASGLGSGLRRPSMASIASSAGGHQASSEKGASIWTSGVPLQGSPRHPGQNAIWGTQKVTGFITHSPFRAPGSRCSPRREAMARVLRSRGGDSRSLVRRCRWVASRTSWLEHLDGASQASSVLQAARAEAVIGLMTGSDAGRAGRFRRPCSLSYRR